MENVRNVLNLCVAAVALYDWFICLLAEWQLIWRYSFFRNPVFRSKSTLFNVLYVIIRYTSIAYYILLIYRIQASMAPEECERIGWFLISAAIIYSANSAIMALRVSTIYLQNRRVDCFLLVGWVFSTAGGLFAATDPERWPGSTSCFVNSKHNRLRGLPLSALLYDSLLLFLLLLRAFQVKRQTGRLTPLLRPVVIYTTIAFAWLFVSGIISTIFAFASYSHRYETFNFSLMVTVVVSCRLLYAIREVVIEDGERAETEGVIVLPLVGASGTSSGRSRSCNAKRRWEASTRYLTGGSTTGRQEQEPTQMQLFSSNPGSFSPPKAGADRSRSNMGASSPAVLHTSSSFVLPTIPSSVEALGGPESVPLSPWSSALSGTWPSPPQQTAQRAGAKYDSEGGDLFRLY